MVEKLENIFVAATGGYDPVYVDWVINNFDYNKHKIIFTFVPIADHKDKIAFNNRVEKDYLQYCKTSKFEAEILIPKGDDAKSIFLKLTTEHRMTKLVIYTVWQSQVSEILDADNNVLCKVWFVGYSDGKLGSIRDFVGINKFENLRKIVEEETNKRKNAEEKLHLMIPLEHQLAECTMLLKTSIKQQEEFRIEIGNTVNKKKMGTFIEFSHLELKEATNDFNESHWIGKGGFGDVYKCILRCTQVAVKKLKPGSSQGDKEFNQEVEILTKVRHPHLVSLIGVCTDAQALIYEFMPNGSLDTFLNSGKGSSRKLSWQNRVRIATEICSALIFLHLVPPYGIAHGDLKPGNVLLDSNLVSKVTDFGISRELYKLANTKTPGYITGNPNYTCGYVAPETLFDGKLTPQSDVYSFGIMLLQFITGKVPEEVKEFVKDAMNARKFDILVDRSAGKWPIEEAKKLASLGLRCIEREGNRRPILATDVWPTLESMKRVAVSLNDN